MKTPNLLSKLSVKKGDFMDNLKTNIQQLRMSVEELEKRIKAISSQVTVNTQITATKACLDEIKNLILEFQDSYNQHLNYCYLSESEHIAEYQSFKESTNTDIQANATNIQELSSKYEEINLKCGHLENQISNLEQMCINTENIANNTEIKCNDLEYRISGYDLAIDELQKANSTNTEQCNVLNQKCTTLENSVTQINTTNQTQSTNISNLQGEVSSLQNTITNGLKQVQALQQKDTEHSNDIQELKSVNNTQSSQISALEYEYPLLKDNLTTHTGEIQTLKDKVYELEANSSSGSGASSQSSLNADYYEETSAQFNFNGTVFSPHFYLCCDANSTVELKFRLECNISFLNAAIPVTITINDTKYIRELRPSQPGVFYATLQLPVIATKNTNLCRVTFSNDIATTHLYRFGITAVGKNVSIYALNKPLNIVCFNQEYYITNRKNGNVLQYGKCPKDSFDVNNIDLTERYIETQADENLILPYMYPTLSSANTLASNSATHQLIYITPDDNDAIHYGPSNSDVQGGCFANKTKSTYSATTIDVIPYSINFGGFMHLYITKDQQAYVYYTKLLLTKTGQYIDFDGHILNDCIYGTLVKNINLGFGSTAPANFNGVILTNSEGVNYLYPELSNAYRVEIAKGKNATAYIQPDESINVYINNDCTVTKYVLRKNAEAVYELSQSETTQYNGYTRIEECYDNKVFAYKYDTVIQKDISEL